MKKKINEFIKHYLDKHSGHDEKIEGFAMFIENFFCEMDEEYEDVKEAFFDELENFTEEIDEEMATAIVQNLKRKDGSHAGMKWTVEETESVSKQFDAKGKIEALGKHYDKLKFWIAMNYVFASHYNINRSTSGYIELAIDELTNKNICFDDLAKHVFKKL